MTATTPVVLVTRPAADAKRFAALLRAKGVTAPIEISPLVTIEPTEAQIDLSPYAGVIFSSRNAVAMVAGQDKPAWCVGAATAAAAQAKGWRAVAADGDAEALYARVLADASGDVSLRPLLHLRGEIARGDIAARLRAAGVLTQDQVVYRQVPQELSHAAKALLAGKRPVIVPLFSPRGAEIFVAHGPFDAPLHVVVMSATIRDGLGNLPCEEIVLANKKQADAMAKAVAGLLDAG